MDAHQLVRQFNYLDLPIGVYVVAPDGNFIECNRAVRQMLGLPLEGPVTSSARDLYADPNQRPEFLKQAVQADERGDYPEPSIIQLRVNNEMTYVEDHCKPLRDPTTREITGYVGCLIDVTAEHQAAKKNEQLQHKVEELLFDIGRVWHANTSTLVMTKQTLDSVTDALGPSPFGNTDPQPEDVDDALVKRAARLAQSILRFLENTDDARRTKSLPESRWQVLSDSLPILKDVREKIPIPELRPPTLRKVAHEITQLCRDARRAHLPRELIKEMHEASWDLERVACLADVIKTRTAIIQMDLPLRALREFITAEVRTHEVKTRLSVKPLIEQTIKHLAEFAKSSNVQIRWREREFDGEVYGNERDLTRVLSNLLHNAIKYTWRRDKTIMPWVQVRAFQDGQKICVEFENWGVPISREEIEQGLIFQLGYRGKWSTDRGRLGTGIGLTDADRVARAHGGEIHVESKPAAPALHPQDESMYYKQPFKTQVTLCLPVLGSHPRGEV